jgi:membrane fusion protein, multidrug efflux system
MSRVTATQPKHPQIDLPPDMPPAPRGRGSILIGAALLVLVTAGIVTLLARHTETIALARDTEAASVSTVAVVHPKATTDGGLLALPGNMQAYEESPIFARTSGYLVRWYKDIGSKVQKGELLATIDTPEVDQQLAQARATREQVRAQLELAKVSSSRWESMRQAGVVSQQDADQQTSGYRQSEANLNAAAAEVRRLEQLESFKRVEAPFSGVLTRRNVDPGALINAGAGSTGQALFVIARVDPLRVFVNVPQAYSQTIKPGAKASVTLQEFPGQTFPGTIARTADAIDPATRTLLTEVDVPNRDGKLLPGSFGQVHFASTKKVGSLTIPVNAMLFRGEGPRVGVVNQNNQVNLHPIVIGRDFGDTIEILGGLDPTDAIIINPSDSLEEGQKVHVAQSDSGQPHP